MMLKEKGMQFELFQENFWERRVEFLKLAPSGQTPVVVLDGEDAIWGNGAIDEYLEEIYTQRKLMPVEVLDRARVRQITEWFDVKFYQEVTKYILHEKIIKTVAKSGYPNSKAIQTAKRNIYYHLDYIGHLRKKHVYLASDDISIADIAAAAQLSVLDYVSDVPWHHNESAKQWYALVKSRPSFKPILNDRIPNINPPVHYADPDF